MREPDDVAQLAAAHLAAIIASADDAIASKTLDGVITSWNAAAERMFGYTADEAIGQSITIVIPPERLHEETDIIARLRRGETIGHFETERRRKDGRLIPVSLTISPIRAEDGRIVGASKIVRDIADRRRAEQALGMAMQRLEALYHLAAEVGRARTVAAVCDAAVGAVMAVGAQRASVLLFDADGVMRFRAWRNLSDGYRAAVEGHSPWSRDTVDPKPVVIEDTATEPSLGALRQVVEAEGIRALVFVPLVSHGQLVGKFMIYYDAPHAFTDAELRLAGSIAHHVAFGFGRVAAEAAAEDLLKREQTARREAEELGRLARIMNDTLDVATAAERIVESALGLFRANAAALRLATPEGNLVGVAFAGAMRRHFSPGHTIPAGPASISGLAMTSGAPVWTNDSFADDRLHLADDIERGMRDEGDAAVLAVPLRHKGLILGALSIADRRGREFTAAQADRLQAFADHAALAVENAQLYEQARRQQREAEVVADVTQRINASLDLQTTLERLVDGARELCGGDVARIVVRDRATGQMILRHQIGARWTNPDPGEKVVEAGAGSGGVVIATGKPFRTDNYLEDPRITRHYVEVALKDGTVSQIVVPIPGEAGLDGLIYIDRRERRPFTDADEALLTRLANHAATAIRNSQLFADEQTARADADAANRGKDQFLAVLSHELRTPLNAMMGWARLLRSGQLDEAQRVRAAEIVERNALLQSQLVSDLIDLSRIAVGKAEIERTPVDLVLVVRQAIDAVSSDLDAKGVALTADLDDTAGEVLGEARRLQQVVTNLLLNAIKFTPAGGRVTARLVRHETSARLTVSDTGEGIDPLLLPRIFDPFEQGDTSSIRRHQGLGLGLAIVRQFVELHGGSIRAESAGKGHGATFTVDLPVLAVRVGRGALDLARPAVATSGGLRGLRVLVVDDQPDARELFAFVLTERGAVVHAAGSASEAMDVLSAQEIDILVSDISMPGTDGYSLIRSVRALPTQGERIRAVAVTAFTGHEVRQRALAAGFDAHATKPLDPEALSETLVKLR